MLLHDRYELGPELGRGSLGVVHLAMDHELRVERALKLLLPEYRGKDYFEKRTMNEARALAQVIHPHVVPFYDLFESPEHGPVLVMKRLHGTTLHQQIRHSGSLPLQEALDVIADVLAGLSAVHAEGIVHRDVKPANLMRTPSGVVLMDFGIARSRRAHLAITQSYAPLGSGLFMAPEQRLDPKDVSPAADLYSAGVCLHQLLLPWRRLDLGLAAKTGGPYWDEIPSPARELLGPMVALDPENRPDAAAWSERFREALHDLGSSPSLHSALQIQ